MQHTGGNQHNNENAYLLGEWQVFPDTGLLIKAGHQIQAEPKVMSVLECLLQAGGRLVTRDELIEKVWAHVVVNDEVLTRAISELRTLLGDVSRERRYIATIPKRGYKLVMPVLPMTARAMTARAMTAPAMTAPVDDISQQIDHSRIRRNSFGILSTAALLLTNARRRLSQPVALTGYLAVSAMLAFSLWMTMGDLDNQAELSAHRADLDQGVLPGNLTASLHAELQRVQISEALIDSVDWMSEHTAQSVLIAPLTAITDDEQTRAFAAGLSVELQHAVFRQPDLQVVQQLPENPLESALILSGSVRVYDQSTRINLQLVEAVTSRLLWSDSFDCPLNAILGLQTQIARQTGQRLQRSFSGKV